MVWVILEKKNQVTPMVSFVNIEDLILKNDNIVCGEANQKTIHR